MRVRLLNHGGFGFLQHLSFPIEIEAIPHSRLSNAVQILASDLAAVGADDKCKNLHQWSFFYDDEIEVVDE